MDAALARADVLAADRRRLQVGPAAAEAALAVAQAQVTELQCELEQLDREALAAGQVAGFEDLVRMVLNSGRASTAMAAVDKILRARMQPRPPPAAAGEPRPQAAGVAGAASGGPGAQGADAAAPGAGAAGAKDDGLSAGP